jgi:hypothetical protein
MPITTSDIKFKLSIKTGTAGNQSAQTDPNQSLGKYISTTEIENATLNNLFDDVSGDENAANDVEYRCFFIHNAHASLTWQNPIIWISEEVAGGASIAIGVDPTAASPIGSSQAQALEIADEDTAPSGVSFSSPTSKGTGLSVGNLSAGYCKAIWVRRTCSNSAAKNNDGATFTVEGDTAE